MTRQLFCVHSILPINKIIITIHPKMHVTTVLDEISVRIILPKPKTFWQIEIKYWQTYNKLYAYRHVRTFYRWIKYWQFCSKVTTRQNLLVSSYIMYVI